MQAADLKTLLDLLLPSLGPANYLPLLGMFIFDEVGVYSFDTVTATKYKWDHGLGKFAVDGKALASLVGQLPSNAELTLKVTGSTLEILPGRGTKIKVPVITEFEPLFEEPKFKSVIASISDFTRLREIISCAATSSISPVYKCIALAAKKGKDELLAYATNGQIMARGIVGEMARTPSGDFWWLVPRVAAQQILALKENDTVDLCLTQEELIAGDRDAMMVVSHLLQETVPAFDKPLQADVITTIPAWKNADLLSALNIASVVCSSFKSTCQLRIEKGEITVLAKGESEFTHTIKAADKAIKGEDCQFTIDPSLLKGAFQLESLDGPMQITDRVMLIGDPSKFVYAIYLERD